jgi:hypothetical protein
MGLGSVRQAWLGVIGLGAAGKRVVRRGPAGKDRQVVIWPGPEVFGLAGAACKNGSGKVGRG